MPVVRAVRTSSGVVASGGELVVAVKVIRVSFHEP
jgi:hypothetical protein